MQEIAHGAVPRVLAAYIPLFSVSFLSLSTEGTSHTSHATLVARNSFQVIFKNNTTFEDGQ